METCECEAQFCPHGAAGCPNPPVGTADIITFHLNICNDCFKRHKEYSPDDVSWIKHASQEDVVLIPQLEITNPLDGQSARVVEPQSDIEVGKPVTDEQLEEVRAEKEVTVEKDNGTQIIINIAGKNKTLGFSNKAIAASFIKGASVKFGGKFKLVAAEVVTMKPGDHVAWHLHQFSPESRQGVVIDVLPQNDEGLVIFDAKQEDMGGNPKGEVWGYMGFVYEINGQQVKPVNPESAEFEVVGHTASMAPQQDADNDKPVTSGMGDINGGAPSFKEAAGKGGYVIQIGGNIDYYKYVGLSPFRLTNLADAFKFPEGSDANEYAVKIKNSKEFHTQEPWATIVKVVPYSIAAEALHTSSKNAGFNFSPSNVPSQVVQEFYPDLQHELISYPNVTNAPMQTPEISGDAHELGTGQAEGIGEATLVMNNNDELPGAIEDAFEGMNRIGYVSTSPAGGAMGRDGKPQVLEGVPLRKELDIKGPMFMEEFYAQNQGIPGNALAISSAKVAAAEEKKQFSLFLKRVMGEVSASFLAAFKVTSKMPMNKVPGVGEIQLAQVEQATNTSTFNVVNTGSRVKYLMEKLTDSEIQDSINDAYAQGAIWHEGKEGGFVYEVFVRAETIDTESMLLKYKFVTGTKEAEE